MNPNRSKKVLVHGGTINSNVCAMDGGTVPRSLHGTSNYSWVVDQLKKLGYVYDQDESLLHGGVVFVLPEK